MAVKAVDSRPGPVAPPTVGPVAVAAPPSWVPPGGVRPDAWPATVAAGPAFVDPHARTGPPATGGLLDLAPWESPTDRVVALAEQVQGATAQNALLAARVRDLEAAAGAREQAVAEAVRQMEAAAAEAAQARADLQASRAAVASLRAKLERIEREDVALLRALLAALEQLLAAGAGQP